MHDVVTLVRAIATGICDIHGEGSPECTAAKEAATLTLATLGGIAVGTAIEGKNGAAPGGMLGFLAGLVINGASEPRST